ncbi:MAG: alpha/beta fold hydrolase [Gemmatimonadota bacterium]
MSERRRPSHHPGRIPDLLALLVLATSPAGPAAPLAAQVPSITSEDYARAEQFLPWNVRQMVSNDLVDPTWLDNDRFWYRNRIPEGHAFVLVDPAASTQRPAFDHVRLADALSAAADTVYQPYVLPFSEFDFLDGDRAVEFWTDEFARWAVDLDTYAVTGPESVPQRLDDRVLSPDGRWEAFQRDYDVWVRSTGTGAETRLSRNGEEHYGYGVIFGHSDVITYRRHGTRLRPMLEWSPDSRMVAVIRVDERKVGTDPYLETDGGLPTLHLRRKAVPGDEFLPMMEHHVFEIPSGREVVVDQPPQYHVDLTCCGQASDDGLKYVLWSSDGDEMFIVNADRDSKRAEIVEVDLASGATRPILEEMSETFLELNTVSGGELNVRIVGDRELIWFSQRSGYGHLYLYDRETGALRNPITSGQWMVIDVEHVDEARRLVYFTAVGREPGIDPYFRQLYRVRLDGTGLERLTPEDLDHQITMSPSGRFIIDRFSSRDTPPVTVLRSADGSVVRTLEEADVSRLLATGWRYPEAFTVKARDARTDLYGYLHFPSHFDPTRKYPIADYVYPGPQVGSVGYRQFSPSRSDIHALAELGFVVVTLDAMGTPMRSKAFHDAYYGDLGDNGIPDHVAALEQLAARHDYLDLDRVGIYGHSGGGFASTAALLRFPGFFKVAVSSAGNHDNRTDYYFWGEKYHGQMRRDEDGSDNYDAQANHLLAENLEGRLLLMYGTLDDRVQPNATLLLIDKLIEHHKDFDVLVLPNRNHGFFNEPYVIGRRWDYFVEHLLGAEPPDEYVISPTPPDPAKPPN